MIFRAFHESAHWITLVVRAPDEDAAQELAVTAFHQYTDTEPEQVSLEVIDPDGPPGVVVEDPS